MATNLYDDKSDHPLKGKMSKSEREKQGVDKPKVNGTAARYWREIERYNREVSDWHQEGDEIEKVYLDENRVQGSSSRKFALLWANVEVLKPAVYAKTPTVLCTRRYRDRDVAGRIAAELMERATNTTFELYGVNEVFKMVRDDRLLPGRGQAWVRYEPTIEQYEDEGGAIDAETGDPVIHERLAGEKVCVDYVHWQDFGHNVAKTWVQDVWLVWRVVYKTQDEVAERFGSDVAARLSYNTKSPGSNSKTAEDPDSRAKIYEIWDKKRRTVSWMVEGEKDFLDTGPPPLNFMNFFPCPEPCYATKTSKSLIPRPDYRYYRDHAKEINDLTEKIGNMSQWLIVKGFVPSGPSSVADPIEEALNDKGNRELFVQVDSMADWNDKGGISKLIDWLPLDKIQAALQGAISIRAQMIQDVFQITGISDILRGQSDPNETLGAQELKAQTGTKRLRNTKDEVGRFCRDTARLVAEVIAENFSPKSIAEITGYRYVPTPPQMPIAPMLPGNVMPMRPGMPQGAPGVPSPMMLAPMQRPMLPGAGGPPMGHDGGPVMDDDTDTSLTFGDDVIQLLRDDRLRSFRIDIETDSTVQADENAEKQQRMEFLNVAVGALERAANTMKVAPDLAPVMSEMVMFAARGMRVGKSLEDVLERAMKKAQKRMEAMAAAPPPPNPMIEIEKAKLQQKAQASAADGALKSRQIDTNAQLAVRKQNIDASLEARKQDIAQITDLRHTHVAADAQAIDRAAQLLGDREPSGRGQ